MNQTKGDITGVKSHIDTTEDHKTPSKLRCTEKRTLQQLAEKQQRTAKILEQQKQPKQTIKDKVMNALFTRIWAFIRDVLLQWAFPFPIFKKSADGITPITDDEGKKVIDWVATASARVLSLVAVFWGTVEVLGLPIAEWVQRIAGALGLPIGG